MNQRILLIGCGNMGGAIARRFISSYPSLSLTILDHHEGALDRHHINEKNVALYGTIDQFPSNYTPDIVIFAVKPNAMQSAMRACHYQDAIYISVAAGISLEFLANHLPPKSTILRTMPNTPVTIGAGTTALMANAHTSKEQIDAIDALFKCLGTTHWIEKEENFHAITALSGSGPAYVFYFIECLQKAACALALSEKLATQLALDMVHGSALFAKSSDIPVDQLRRNVTSKGGTTEAALDVLFKNQSFEHIIEEALKAACIRSQKLSKDDR